MRIQNLRKLAQVRSAHRLDSTEIQVARSFRIEAAASDWDPSVAVFERHNHTATLIDLGNSGRDRSLVVVGGIDAAASVATDETLVYSPWGNSWTTTAPAPAPRTNHSTTTIRIGADGREALLVVGGYENPYAQPTVPSARVDLFDPRGGPGGTPIWINKASLGTARGSHFAVALEDGRVLVIGGTTDFYNRDGYALESVEIYDPVSDTWTSRAPMSKERDRPRGQMVRVGADAHEAILIAGGKDLSGAYPSEAELYDVPSDTWTTIGNVPNGTDLSAMAKLSDGRIWFSGGTDSSFAKYDDAAIYAPSSTGVPNTTWTTVASLTDGRYAHTVLPLPSGLVLVAGGYSGGGYIEDVEAYDPATDSWSTLGTNAISRYEHTVTLLDDGRVLFYGGNDGFASASYDRDNAAEWIVNYPTVEAPVSVDGIGPFRYRLKSGTGYLFSNGRYVPNQYAAESAQIEMTDSTGATATYTIVTEP